jgi:hypothetical protein
MKRSKSKQGYIFRLNAVLSDYITTLKNKQKLDVSSEGPSFETHFHFGTTNTGTDSFSINIVVDVRKYLI